jgi:hypothetical protein
MGFPKSTQILIQKIPVIGSSAQAPVPTPLLPIPTRRLCFLIALTGHRFQWKAAQRSRGKGEGASGGGGVQESAQLTSIAVGSSLPVWGVWKRSFVLGYEGLWNFHRLYWYMNTFFNNSEFFVSCLNQDSQDICIIDFCIIFKISLRCSRRVQSPEAPWSSSYALFLLLLSLLKSTPSARVRMRPWARVWKTTTSVVPLNPRASFA